MSFCEIIFFFSVFIKSNKLISFSRIFTFVKLLKTKIVESILLDDYFELISNIRNHFSDFL